MPTYSYTLYSYRDMKANPSGYGLRLLRKLVEQAPEHFNDVGQYVFFSHLTGVELPTLNDDLSGLLVRKEDGHVVTVATMRNEKLDRLYTLPQHRGKGHATKLLAYLFLLSSMGGWTFISPVKTDLLPMFVRAGWTRRPDSAPNRDKTRDMVTNPQFARSGMMDIGRWFALIKDQHEEIVPF